MRSVDFISVYTTELCSISSKAKSKDLNGNRLVCDCSVGQARVEIDLETKLHMFNSAAQLAMGELKGTEIVLFFSSLQDLLSLASHILQLEKKRGKGEKRRKEAWC